MSVSWSKRLIYCLWLYQSKPITLVDILSHIAINGLLLQGRLVRHRLKVRAALVCIDQLLE